MKKNNGFVLIFVLGYALALSSLIIFFNYETKKYIDFFTKYIENVEMERICDIGFEISRKILENDKNNYDWIGENWAKERNYKIGNYDMKIVIKDENSKINLNKIIGEKGQINQSLLELLKNLFAINGYSSSLLDCLLDWMDEDNLERPLGAEFMYYSSIGLKGIPFNKPLSYLRELFLIKDYDEKIIKGDREKNSPGLLDFVTIYSDDKININTCRREIINAMGFTNEEVEAIIEEREKHPLTESFLIGINKNAYLKNKGLIKYKSNYFYVYINVKSERGEEKYIEGIIKKDKNVGLIKKGVL